MRDGRRWVIGVTAVAPALALLLGLRGAGGGPSVDRVPFPELRGLGLSGVTPDGDGRFWVVSEDHRALYRFDGSWSATGEPPISIAGIAGDLEPESAAWLGGGRIALGTETDLPRGEDTVVVVQVRGQEAEVVGSSIVSWQSMLGLRAPPNHGIEGLCAGERTVLAAAEWVVELDGRRLAALARAQHHDGVIGAWEPLMLRLTSDTGKLSSLDCIEGRDGELSVHAVERHYGITRVLRFHLPSVVARGEIAPEIVLDVSALPDLPNVEGICLGAERIFMLSDHDPVDVRGTTELLAVDSLAERH
jgi:hypothetical protein